MLNAVDKCGGSFIAVKQGAAEHIETLGSRRIHVRDHKPRRSRGRRQEVSLRELTVLCADNRVDFGASYR